MVDNFNYHNYLDCYSNLRHMSEKEAYEHYLTYGKKEGRSSGAPINNTTNVTIIIHLFNQNLLDEMNGYINEVKRVFSKVNIIISVNKKLNDSRYIKGSHLIEVENKGVDAYPFLVAIQYIREHNIPTDYILKLHTKESNNQTEDLNNWRKELILPITNYNNLLVLQHYFISNPNIGYVSSQKCVFPKNFDLDFPHNIKGINNLCESFPHLEKDWTDFNGGNIFWISYPVLQKYLTDNLIEYLKPKFLVGRKPPCNLRDKGIYVEYLCERLFTGVFCFNKTNIAVNDYSGTHRGTDLANGVFYQPKVFSIISNIS